MNNTLEMKIKFDILNTNNLEKIQKSNFTSTVSGSDLNTILAKYVIELEQEILVVKMPHMLWSECRESETIIMKIVREVLKIFWSSTYQNLRKRSCQQQHYQMKHLLVCKEGNNTIM